MKIVVAGRITFDTVLEWFLEFQRSTGNAVCEIRMEKRIYTKAIQVSEALLIEGALYGATFIKDNSVRDAVEVTGC
jgi:hypothetical protein